jgi:hypothetical protein
MTRVAGHPSGRFLGYVQVQVASRTYALRVEALPPNRGNGPAAEALEPGFFAEGADCFGILVDGEASSAVVEKTIERASAEAARHISRTLLN